MTLINPGRTQRRAFSFAAAMPPRAEAMFPTQRWLAAVAAAGYTHLCLQNDPFFHPEMDLRDTGENTFRLLSLFDLTTGPRHPAYLQWLGAVDAAAAGQGLKLAMELWEPRLSRPARQLLPPQWKGPPSHGGWVEPLCVSVPEARQYLLKGFMTLAGAMPHLNALVLGVNDNSAWLCGPACPRCGQTDVRLRLGTLYADIEKVCRQVRADLQVIPYDWMWDEEHYQAVFGRLAERPMVLTRLERGVDHTPDPANPRWHGRVFDESVGCDGVGRDFGQAQRMMRQRQGQVLVMPTLSGMFEGFHLPYVPAMGQVARKFDRMRCAGVAGWVDYDCGGIHEGLMLDLVATVQHHPEAELEQWLDELARRRYGDVAAGIARRIWESFDQAVRLWPGQLEIEGIAEFSGRFGIAMGLLPLHPFLPERLGAGEQAQQAHFHFDPHCFARPQALAPVRALLAKTRRAVVEVPAWFAQLVAAAPPGCHRAAELDRDIAQMVLLNWRSAANFFEWAAARQGDGTVDLPAVLRDEIETTRRFRELAVRPELGYGNMTWHPERCVAMSVPQAAADLWRPIEINRCAAWVNQPCVEQVGNLWGWKVAHLERQLSMPAPGACRT